MRFKGRFKIQHYRCGKMIDRIIIPNAATDQGLNHILATQFLGGTPSTDWYMGLIDAVSFTGTDPSDTLDTHPGWYEVAGYSGDRPQWSPSTLTGTAIANLTPITFNMSGPNVLKGIFICNKEVPPDLTTDILWATALFDADRTVAASDALNVFYEVEAARG